jgi:hypothetical protein
LAEGFFRHCAVGEAAEARSRTEHRVWWVLASVEKRRRGSAHNDMRPGETTGAAALQCSRAGTRVEERSSMEEWEWLLKHLVLEREALDRHSQAHRDEAHAKQLRLELAVAEWECEALGEASSCRSAHGLLHHEEHRVDHIQNELGTDLQLG